MRALGMAVAVALAAFIGRPMSCRGAHPGRRPLRGRAEGRPPPSSYPLDCDNDREHADGPSRLTPAQWSASSQPRTDSGR